MRGLDEVRAPAALMGSSLGAFVAVHAALKRPSQVDRLVLLAQAATVAVAALYVRPRRVTLQNLNG